MSKLNTTFILFNYKPVKIEKNEKTKQNKTKQNVFSRTFLLLSTLFLLSNVTYSQVKETEISSKNSRGKAELINFRETKINSDEKSVNQFLKKQFKSENEVDFKLNLKSVLIEKKLESKKLQQFYKGIKVEFGTQNVVSENGILKTANGRYVDVENLDINPQLSEKEALEFALKNIGAKEYMWESKENEVFLKKEQNDPKATYYPKGELLIIEKDLFGDNPTPRLAYKFNIASSLPFSSNNFYIDSVTGEVLLIEPTIFDIQGIADTRYSGQKVIVSQQTGAQYKLRDYTRGSGIETYNMKNKGNNFGAATDFIDNDNNWTSLEYNNTDKDNAALDAHWGAEKTFDYFLIKHNRNSFDNLGSIIKSYVHADLTTMGLPSNDNAFWSGQYKRMVYGDGQTTLTPVVSIDVIAHEIGHGVNNSPDGPNLIYEKEPGAINEGLSDIWGAMIENFADSTKQTYLIGEEIKIGGGALRSMSNPKSQGQPDTYGGTYWRNPDCGVPDYIINDYCGVHYNSGVFNHWFYIMAEGKSGTNGIGNSYSVIGIGKEKAAKIVYRAEIVYFTATTNYVQARDLTIQAAIDLYGSNSIESQAVCQSWYAVGVGNNNCVTQFSIVGGNTICSTTSNYTYNLSPSSSSVVWTVSSNLIIISSSSSNIVIQAAGFKTKGLATITANVGGIIKTKNIWIGKPAIPEFIYGPATVLTGAMVNYSSSEAQGATSYDWWLPYPYDSVSSFNYFGQNWQKLTNYSSSSSIQVFTGYAGTAGLVQVMGLNECGCGGAKSMSVVHGTGGAGSGQIPITGISENTTKYIVYPNPSNDIIYIDIRDKNNTVINGANVFGEVFDLQGNSKTKVQIIDNKATVNVKNLQKGIYILKIDINGQIESHQIIVE